MSGLEFTEDAARQLERLYLTGDVVAQRSETIKLLALARGERVLDVGCGPGFLCEGIAEVVGRHGAVTGIDISGDLIALCKRRNPPTWLSYAAKQVDIFSAEIVTSFAHQSRPGEPPRYSGSWHDLGKLEDAFPHLPVSRSHRRRPAAASGMALVRTRARMVGRSTAQLGEDC